MAGDVRLRGAMVIVITGPAGAGKTTVGRRLAAELGWEFYDADDFHPPASVARMRAGSPLGEAERTPWLAGLADLIERIVRERRRAVLACSALKQAYRRALVPEGMPPDAVRFVYLKADAELLTARLSDRRGHFFAAELMETQLADLEEPAGGEPAPVLTLDGVAPVESLVERIRAALRV